MPHSIAELKNMVFRRFRIQVVVRVILIMVTFMLIFYIHQQTAYAISSVILAVLFIAQIVSLIRYTEQTNIKLAHFFESIRHADFTSSFSDNQLGKSFEGLNKEFNEVISAFNKNKTEKEEHHDEHEEASYEARVVEIIAYSGNDVAVKGIELGVEYVSEGVYFVKSQLLKSSLGGHGH